MTLTPEQHEERQTGVGGSEVAIILGISPYMTARELYHRKRGEIVRDETETEDQWWGRMMEPIVRQKYAEETGLTLLMPPGTLRHHEHKFMVAHPDGISLDARLVTLERFGCAINRGYEGKIAYHSIGWGEEHTDALPRNYLLQVHHYMTVTEFQVWDVAAMVGRKFRAYEVLADAEMSEMLISIERDFMEHVTNGVPPETDYRHPTAVECMKKLYRGTNGQRIDATEECITWRRRLDRAKRVEKVAKARAEHMQARLLDAMGENALMAFPDGKCYRRQETNNSGYVVAPFKYMDTRFVKDPELKGRR